MSTATVETRRAQARPASPYVGLVPFGEDDAAFFFGRSREIDLISANLRSARLTIVYGPSGVGKSSLLLAGVVHRLRDDARAAAFDVPFAVCVVRSWLDADPRQAVLDATHDALQHLSPEALAGPCATLVESLRAWTQETGTLLVLLDQFEEYFQYHPDDGDGERLTGFAAELAEIVNDPNLAVNVLISIREDAWAKLDRFEGHIPILFTNYIRVDHLDEASAREAIEGPIAAWNRTLRRGDQAYDVEPELTAAVLSAAAGGLSGSLDGDEARGAAQPAAGREPTERVRAEAIEAPFLQLVLERMWRATVDAGDRVLTLERLNALGGPRAIVENHLLQALARLSPHEQDVASECFQFLVSRSRTKIAHTADDLAGWTNRPVAQVVPVLDRLCSGESGRILRAVAPDAGAGAARYELFHDVLAEPILAWRRRHERDRERRAARRRLLRVGSVALALVAVFGALAVWALIERGHATHQYHRAVAATARANALYGQQVAISKSLRRENDKLANEAAAKARKNAGDATLANARRVRVAALQRANHRLTRDVAALRAVRTALDRSTARLRARNRRLAAEVVRLNRQNKALAARINRLDRRYAALAGAIALLVDAHGSLRSDAEILGNERATLGAVKKTDADRWEALSATAAPLGFSAPLPPQARASPVANETAPPPRSARLFGIPAELAASDALRKRIAELERRQAALLRRRARQADLIGWLRKDNSLLTTERAALRRETAQLRTTQAALESRRRKLVQTVGAASSERSRLTADAAAREARTRRREHAYAVQKRANSALQSANNGTVETLGGLQAKIRAYEKANRRLVAFLDAASSKLARGAQNPSLDRVLAGLLAAEAYRVTPYDADDPAHPGVYNALWLALDRFDPAAAQQLVAPTTTPKSKVATTTSAILVKRLCTFVDRGFTRPEWTTWLPAGAPYATASSRPCG